MRKQGIFKLGRNTWQAKAAIQAYIAYQLDEERRTQQSAAGAHISNIRAREIDLRNSRNEASTITKIEHNEVTEFIENHYLKTLEDLPEQISVPGRERQRIKKIINTRTSRLKKKFAEVRSK